MKLLKGLCVSIRSSAAIVVLGLSGAQGCASEPAGPAPLDAERRPVTFVPEAVNVGQGFADAVTVEDDRLVVPSSRRELANIEVGSIVAGNRSSLPVDSDANHNPLGFLRKVTGITTEGTRTVLATEKAQLVDWIADGDLDYSDVTSLLPEGDDDDDGSLRTQANKKKKTADELAAKEGGEGNGEADLASEAEGESSDPGAARLKASFKLTKAKFSFNAKFYGHVHTHKTLGVTRGADFDAGLKLKPTLTTEIELAVRLGAGEKAEDAIKLFEKSWKPLKKAIVIPLPGPVPATLTFEPEIKCSLSAKGAVSTKATATIGTEAEFGVKGNVDLPLSYNAHEHHVLPTKLTTTFSVVSSAQAELTAKCAILVNPSVATFDTAQIKGQIGPYLQLTAEACSQTNQTTGASASAIRIYEQHGLQGELKARVQFPLIHKGKDFDLLKFATKASSRHYLVGDATSCTAPQAKEPEMESCAGLSDGFHCSTDIPWSGRMCVGGQIAFGKQCEETQRCLGGTEDSIQCE